MAFAEFCMHLIHANMLSGVAFMNIQERERRSPPFNLQIHPFSDGVSALQIYCMKEGVKVSQFHWAGLTTGVADAVRVITYIDLCK